MDFSKARVGGISGNIYTAPMQGLMHSSSQLESISAQTLKTWFEPFVKELNIRAIPSSGMMEDLRKMKKELTANKAGST